jgi:protein transport protein SEC61 subunit gamma and related proteins
MDFKKITSNLKSFFVECKRVFRVTKKPTNLEFKTIVKASGLGIIVIGMIGFIISMINQMIF